MSPTYVTKHGIRVHDKTTVISPLQEEVEEVTSFVVKHLGHANRLEDVDMTLYNMVIVKPHPKKDYFIVADGYTDFFLNVYLSFQRNCIADSGLVHELAHVLKSDHGHQDKRLWEKVGRLEQEAIKKMCYPGYVSEPFDPNYVPPK